MEELVPGTPQTFAYLASFRSPVVLRKEKTVVKFTSRPEGSKRKRASRPEVSKSRESSVTARKTSVFTWRLDDKLVYRNNEMFPLFLENISFALIGYYLFFKDRIT